MAQLKSWRMKIYEDGSCNIIGLDQRGFKQVLSSDSYFITEFDTNYIMVASHKDNKHFMCRFRDVCWSKPMVSTRVLKAPLKKDIWHAVNDLLAESSLYAFELSDVLNLVELQEQYPSIYDNVDMDSIAGVTIGAIRQRDSSL